MADAVENFLGALVSSLRDKTFVKLTLGNYKGTESELQRILARVVSTTKGLKLSLVYRYKTQDITKNLDLDEAVESIKDLLAKGFRSGHLFTSESDFQLELKTSGKSLLSKSGSTFSDVPDPEHNRKKKRLIQPSAPYLASLGVTDKNGRVFDKQRDKWRQINKYVEILGNLIDGSPLAAKKRLTVVDMGSGKGYLTFAAYDYLNNVRNIETHVTGVEARKDLVDLCDRTAAENGFEKLQFRHGTIEDTNFQGIDILIALHACNTATDDAIFKGIRANADLIITAPCCHQEVRPQMKPPDVLKGLLKHGILLEHEAETITDGIRAMELEANGYSSKVFEFVGVEHTPKNNMIVGTRRRATVDKEEAEKRIQALMDLYGIREQRLHSLLAERHTVSG
jgi:SAM-dependent methyltransferase